MGSRAARTLRSTVVVVIAIGGLAGFRCPGKEPVDGEADDGAAGGGGEGGDAEPSSAATTTGGGCVPTPPDPAFRRAFISDAFVLPVFGGALAADALCQSYADAACLEGTWMAWVSDSATSPAERFVRAAVPYQVLDGAIVASDWADLTDGVLTSPIHVTETSRSVFDVDGVDVFEGRETWTGTGVDGQGIGTYCGVDWSDATSSALGYAGVARDVYLAGEESQWTLAYLQFCNRTNVRLYCFEQ